MNSHSALNIFITSTHTKSSLKMLMKPSEMKYKYIPPKSIFKYVTGPRIDDTE